MNKKESLKRIIRALHGGLDVEEARRRVVKEVGSIDTKELVQIEQELINEGLSPEEVTKFCNVHVLLVKDSLEAEAPGEAAAASRRPLELLRRENAEIQGLSERMRSLVTGDSPVDAARITPVLERLGGLDRHYGVKENLLFPYLERHGFPGPSKVMWQKDNEVRALLKSAREELARYAAGKGSVEALRGAVLPLLDEAEGMVTKEEQILFPAAAERLDAAEWARVAIELDELGLPFLSDSPRGEAENAAEEAAVSGGAVLLPSGRLTVTELRAMLDSLPFDVTFVDADDKVRYFSEGKDRIFMRTRAVIGRAVQNCHPPKSLAAVEKVVDDLKSGRADHHDFWIELQGRLVWIRYFAVRDRDGKYLGTLEVTQDLSEARSLKGEKRLAT